MKAFIAIAVCALVLVCEASPQGRRPPRPAGRGRPDGPPPRGPPSGRPGGPPALPEELTNNVTALAASIGVATLTAELNAVSANNVTGLLDILTEIAAGNKGGVEADWAQAQIIMEAMLSGGPGFGNKKGRGRALIGLSKGFSDLEGTSNDRKVGMLKRFRRDDSSDETNETDDTNENDRSESNSAEQLASRSRPREPFANRNPMRLQRNSRKRVSSEEDGKSDSSSDGFM